MSILFMLPICGGLPYIGSFPAINNNPDEEITFYTSYILCPPY